MVDVTAETVAREIKGIGADIKALETSTQVDLKALRDAVDAQKIAVDPLVTEKVNALATAVEAKHKALGDLVAGVVASVETHDQVLKRPGFAAGWAGEDAVKDAKAAFDWHKARLANRGQLGVNTEVTVDADAYAALEKHFSAYLRARSDNAMAPAVQAAMQTASDPDGGYLVPNTVSSRIIKRIYETSNLRALATVESIGGKELEIPRDEGEFGTGGWVGETTAPSETTTSQVGVSKIFAHEMFAEPRVTQSMLEDAGMDIEAWVANKVGEKFGRVEATAFFSGTGVNQPRGLLTYANGTTNGFIERVVSGHATQVTADALYNLAFQLKDYYTANARFLMKRFTLRDVMKLKDGQGNYLWQMGDVRGGQPATLLGYPVERCEDMPTLAASSLSVAFGDFKAAYTIVDRLGITLLRDNLTAKPYVKFYNRRRVGGDVVNFEAVKLMVTST
ncbi:MAG: phage major capsid protein [Xanthobacteraceae bacterium]